MFDYDQESSLDVEEVAVEERDGAHVHDISYATANGARVNAYLIAPAGKGPFAGIVFLHGGEQDRSDFLDEALLMARAGGAVSLLIDVPSVRAMPRFTEPELDRDRVIETIISVRRGVDLLASSADVDDGRVGFVGLSFGAWMGAMLASVEKRVKAYVLIAGPPSMSEIWRSSEHPVVVRVRQSLTEEQMERYLEVTAPLDAVNYIGCAAPSALFLQFAHHDDTISEEEARQYSQTASEPKLTRWYDARHYDIFINAEALRERAAWLREQIGIGPLPPGVLKSRTGKYEFGELRNEQRLRMSH